MAAIQQAESSVPQRKYQQILERLTAEIFSGRLAPGAALPTEAELCRSLRMARGTVRQALAELEGNGIIRRIQGRGSFVTTEQERQAKQQLDVFALIAPQLRVGIYPTLIHGFEEACARQQHQTLVGNSGNDVGRQADLILLMIDRSVGGVAIVPTTASPTPAHQIRQLHKNNIPVVFCHRKVLDVAAPAVIFHGHEIGFKTGKKLVELGHRKITMLSTHRYCFVDECIQGLRDAIREAGIDPKGVMPIEYGLLSLPPSPKAKESIHKTLDELLAKPDRPTAIFCGNAPDAEAVYLYAQAKGLQIPRDLSLLNFGAAWRDHSLAGRISTMAVDEHELGVCAARLLHEMRTGKRPLDDDEQIVFPVSELPGETLAVVPDYTREGSS